MARLSSSLHESLTDDIIQSLFNNRIFTITDFLEQDSKSLNKTIHLTYKEILDIRKQIFKTYSAKIQNGAELYSHLLQNTSIIPTNIKNFDDLIGGGILSDSVYEICGFSATGKTQLCLTLAINISYYVHKTIYYIDTKQDFNARRIQAMLEKRKYNEEISGQILNNIRVKKINDQNQLIEVLYEIKNELQTGLKCPLIIIDSLPAIFYRTGNYNTNLTVMNDFVNIMRYISAELNTSFIVTNIVIKDNLTNPASNLSTFSIKPGLGSYWCHIPTMRILITKIDENQLKMSILKSITIECNKNCDVTLSNTGIE